ncbi:sulfatase-like hydrolase/transferase [Natrialbaceae archaeon AArc-T1-2]|uniref:sulfatase-like hydrolase/transferase n=1 Tax=Natrialbaceae archaeon AArc-T1-2 TaxID=3053904 RepID=UPI00255ACC2F|nr:sulfatase-like hydrolase/transferase [Natrialbaceae archaeon AArc-T1-2]WIV67056.1 sulfatase-like hydrolase/transferase [Natrialbaceae archaeon AArc-T1-2]
MRNVVLLCLDSVRKDTFDAYARRLDRRIELSYEQCRAASSWSAPSYASMLTGDLAHDHGVCTHDKRVSSIDPSETFLAREAFEGHEAIGVSTNAFAGSAFGFDRFFDRFADVTESNRYPDALDPASLTAESDASGPSAYLEFLREAVRHDRPLESLANGAVGFLDTVSADAPVPKLFDDGARAVIKESKRSITTSREPLFLFTTFMEAHTPLQHIRGFDRSLHSASNGFTTYERSVWELMEATDDHESFLETRRELYDATVDYLDRTITPFLAWLETNTALETTVVITADHGENQGYPCEEGHVRHKSSLSEGLLHVPLAVVNPPDGYPEIEDGYVSHLELGDLLAAFAREEVVDLTRDRVVAEHVGMSAGPEPPERREYWDRLMRAAYEDGRKVVWDSLGNARAYGLDPARPCWQRRVEDDASVPPWAEEYFDEDAASAKRRLAEDGESEDAVDAAVQDRLEKLGYA